MLPRYLYSPLVLPVAAVVAFGWLAGTQLTDFRRLRTERDSLRARVEADSAALGRELATAAVVADSLADFLALRVARDSVANKPYIVVSIADNRLWLKRGEDVLFETRVATGSGKYLEKEGGERWKFETPRGRLVVLRKDVEPAWVPPDWHFEEAAQRRKLRPYHLARGDTLRVTPDAVVTVSGDNVVTRYSDGVEVPFEVRDGGEIRVGDKLIVPPFGTNQRRYNGVLGVNRLYLGDGYAIHGTDNPRSIGQSVSHGCIRVRNEDIETLFRVVAVGTPVYVY
jgi:hypothetical protein